jgi:NAD(P)-dependent dehydrogenase (short-subunit alcohol dehydrogenase family)
MTDANEFEGEVVLVTAAAGLGIGQATVRRLAAGGADVVVTDIHPGRTAKVAKAIREDYPDSEVLGIPLDAGDRDQIDAVVAAVVEAFGRIDILVNNAAVNIIKPVFDCDPEDWDRVMAVNINGP